MKLAFSILLVLILITGCTQQQKTVKLPSVIENKTTAVTEAPPPEKSVEVPPVKAEPVPDELLTDDINKSLEDLDSIGDLNLSDPYLK